MDLDSALAKHSEWKKTFRIAIYRQLEVDADTIARDDCCELGKWLHGEGQRQFGKLDSFAKCIASHRQFHIEAGKIACAINAKKFREAESMLANGSQYVNITALIVSAILKLKADASQ